MRILGKEGFLGILLGLTHRSHNLSLAAQHHLWIDFSGPDHRDNACDQANERQQPGDGDECKDVGGTVPNSRLVTARVLQGVKNGPAPCFAPNAIRMPISCRRCTT